MLFRLLSGMYSIVNGHIYFKNEVIKIRYDLMDKPDVLTFSESHIFDYYDNLLDIESHQ